jgi:thiol-disulfide isomerase/thioredoxin
MTGLEVLLVAVAAACIVGLLARTRGGRLRSDIAARAGDRDRDLAGRAALASVGFRPGEAAATLVQFSSAFCAPCRTTRVVLADVARSVDGVRYVEIDAESHLEAVRALAVLRTPTTFVVDRNGAIRHRAVGVPRTAQVVAAVRALAAVDQTDRERLGPDAEVAFGGQTRPSTAEGAPPRIEPCS